MVGNRLIVIVGGTGNQGGSVARTFLGLSHWDVRCLTRKPSSDAAKALSNAGAEVFQADLDDVSSLRRGFEGAHAIFINTDFWETWRPAKAALEAKGEAVDEASELAFNTETRRTKHAVDVAATIGTLQRLVYSTLTDVSKMSGGKWSHTKHSAAKGWTVDYIKQHQPDLDQKTSFILLGAYDNNALLTPRLDQGSGKFVLATPFQLTDRLPFIDQKRSTGPFVRALIEDERPRTKLLAYDSYPTMDEVIKTWSKERGEEAVYRYVSVQTMQEKMGLTREHLQPLEALMEHGYTGGDSTVIEPKDLKMNQSIRS